METTLVFIFGILSGLLSGVIPGVGGFVLMTMAYLMMRPMTQVRQIPKRLKSKKKPMHFLTLMTDQVETQTEMD